MTDYVNAVAAYFNEQADRIRRVGGEPEINNELRERSTDIVNDLVRLGRIVFRVAEEPGAAEVFPVAEARMHTEQAIRQTRKFAARVPGATVPPVDEVFAVARNSERMLWDDQVERLATCKARGLRLVDEIADNLEALNEHAMLVGIAELDDLIEDIDRDDDLLGRAAAVRLRQRIASARESIAADLTDEPSLDVRIGRRWVANDLE